MNAFLVFKGVRYGLNLIGGWSPVSIFMVTVSVCVKSESFLPKYLTFLPKDDGLNPCVLPDNLIL